MLPSDDQALAEVIQCLEAVTGLKEKLATAVRTAIDTVLESRITGRYDIYGDNVSQMERTYVGTRVELEIIGQLDIRRGTKLDMDLCGHNVDVKHTLGNTWMVPKEAVDELCLLVQSNDREGVFAVGLLRCSPAYLNKPNQDQKRSINAIGKAAITWMVPPGTPLPANFLLHLSDVDRSAILSPSSGQARVNELFRRCLDIRISRYVVEAVAQQKDAQKRVRDARGHLQREGITILSGRYGQREAAVAGLPGLSPDEFMSTRRIPPAILPDPRG